MKSCDIYLVPIMFSLWSFNLTLQQIRSCDISAILRNIWLKKSDLFTASSSSAKFYQRSGKLNQLNQNQVMQTEKKKTPLFVFIYFIIRKPFLYSRILCRNLLKVIPILSIVLKHFSVYCPFEYFSWYSWFFVNIAIFTLNRHRVVLKC